MSINPAIFKAYDIRGIYPSQINEDTIDQVMRGIYTYFAKRLGKDQVSIVLGCDMRTSSPSLHDRAIAALSNMGAHIADIGLSSTPTVYFTALSKGFDAGIQISASHNPGDYNGIKFFICDSGKIVKIAEGNGMEDIRKIVVSGTFAKATGTGTVTKIDDALFQEIDAAFDSVKPTIGKLTIVADAANAMGAPVIEEIAKQIDVKLITMNFTLDGSFPSHQADPLQFKLWKDLQQRVVSEKAHLGIMPDGDSDRVFFVDEKGAIIPATLITALITKQILTHHPKEKIIVDIRYVRNVEAVIKKYGGQMLLSRVGHSLITPMLNDSGAYFAGESSGHYYFAETGGAESASRVILYVLSALSQSGKTMSELLAKFHTSVESGEINFKLHEGVATSAVFDSIQSQYAEGTLSTLDGIAITFPDWRMSLRASNTEPLVRLNIEGATEELVSDKVKEVTSRIVKCGAEVE